MLFPGKFGLPADVVAEATKTAGAGGAILFLQRLPSGTLLHVIAPTAAEASSHQVALVDALLDNFLLEEDDLRPPRFFLVDFAGDEREVSSEPLPLPWGVASEDWPEPEREEEERPGPQRERARSAPVRRETPRTPMPQRPPPPLPPKEPPPTAAREKPHTAMPRRPPPPLPLEEQLPTARGGGVTPPSDDAGRRLDPPAVTQGSGMTHPAVKGGGLTQGGGLTPPGPLVRILPALEMARLIGTPRQSWTIEDVSVVHNISHDGSTVWVALVVGRVELHGEEPRTFAAPNLDAHITLAYGRPAVFAQLPHIVDELTRGLRQRRL